MANAAPTAGTPTGMHRTPDVFDANVHRVMAWVTPVALGLVYGYWTAEIRRSGGPITGWNVLFGFVTALAFMVLYVAVRTVTRRLPRELHAGLWTAFIGCAFGFSYSQTDASVGRAVLMSLAVSAGAFLVLFYRYYTHEDAEGHRIR
ncbi:hypothetical protein ACF1AO_27485 [Streptomyces longwoodensis]|uniref:hypothetical protein n=1 Tax=Streptomyces longwoodensis TaxID=68231 RepID=UPI003701FB1A